MSWNDEKAAGKAVSTGVKIATTVSCAKAGAAVGTCGCPILGTAIGAALGVMVGKAVQEIVKDSKRED